MPKDIVLCVDDEPIVLRLCSTAVSLSGLRCALAENGIAGFDAFVQLKDEICLVLADIIMPIIDGIDMAERILQIDPQMKILLMSGCGDVVLNSKGANAFPLIRKPFIHSVLIAKIRSILGTSANAASAT